MDAAIEMSPDFPEAYYFRGATLKQLGQEHNAINDINMAIELDPQSKTSPDITEILNQISTRKIEKLSTTEITNKIIDLECEVKRLSRLYAGILSRIAGTL